ncbi:PadR family transcriptional regulator [Microbacterium sp. nov. GSS16]|uniref:PadR family transcriptional regulator n=1 Tax=Microbacterium sp. nov. GSS16 TaxID=3019890 RepID=UPI0023061108|nr:PadR family transcriptional regulator [Microbacterium sp. nov. GSS16]WCD93260.1 PadR family transcriptional regulator [Microbacterium sp. nov. GSS16]
MNGSFPSSGFNFGSSNGAGNPLAGVWEAVEQLRSGFEQRTGGSRMARGDVRAAVISLLAERPMHGYQIISEISERSGGAWKPSAGSVYPTLQLLADEGLISADEQGGRKTYSLTDAGIAESEALAARPAPWEGAGQRGGSGSSPLGGLPKAGMELASAAAQLGRTGTPDQVKQGVEILEDARRRLYAILAEG